ncbi:MAG: PQQ-dependent sugar dehydrogenase [Patescibacteria group bacterium]|jgi:glucose/arabinose dehydrogenase
MSKTVLLTLVIVLVGIGIFFLYSRGLLSNRNQLGTSGTANSSQETEGVTVVAENLEVPWAIAFLPNQDLLVTERPGRVRRVSQDGTVTTVAEIDEVEHVGEGGLLGITLHPDFAENNLLYVYYTYESAEDQTLNRVVRYGYENTSLSNPQVIVDQIPGASNHNGGRIAFGPDNFLYITTGDAQDPSLAQDTDSLAGKILRVTDEGEPAPGNPYNNAVYSYGHRNPQGLAWDGEQLWATEHGPNARDELNRIEAGENYGWPEIVEDEQREGMQMAIINSGNSTWAPSGLAFSDGIFYFSGLRGNALFAFNPQSNKLQQYLRNEYGRLREATIGPNGFLYVTTSNRDGRGRPNQGDDKIIRINPNSL